VQKLRPATSIRPTPSQPLLSLLVTSSDRADGSFAMIGLANIKAEIRVRKNARIMVWSDCSRFRNYFNRAAPI